MKITCRKALVPILVLAVAAGVFTIKNDSVKAYDFEGNESYWSGVCSDFNSASQQQDACNAYNNYLSNKVESIDTSNLSASIDDVKDDLSNLNDIADKLTKQKETVQSQIDQTNSNLDTLQASITQAENDIATKEENIESRKKVVKKRMSALQPEVNTNQFIDYIMGAQDLVDLIQRATSVNSFTENDEQQIDQLNADKKQLENDKKEKERIEETVKIQKENLEKQQTLLAALEDSNNQLMAKYQSKMESMQAELQAQAEAAAAAAKAQQEAGTLASAAINTSSSDGTVTNNDSGASSNNTATVAVSGGGAAIAAAALAQVGASQDCTMLVTNSLKAVGIYFHGWPSDYYSLGTVVSASAAQPGDICIYNGHVAIYIGNGMAVHGGWNGVTTVIWSVNCANGSPTYVRVRGC